MEWSFPKDQHNIPISNFSRQGSYQDSFGTYLAGLLLEIVAKDFSFGESPKLARTFLNDFLKFKRQYLHTIFALLDGFILPIGCSGTEWLAFFSQLLKIFSRLLDCTGHKNVLYGLLHSAYYLFSILVMYNSMSEMFFTPIGELGFALHDMFEVSLLSMEELPYNELVPTMEELRWMKTHDS